MQLFAQASPTQARQVKIREILFITFAVYGIWHAVWKLLGHGFAHLEPLKLAGIALTMVWASKLFMHVEKSSFLSLMGALPDRRGAAELAALLLLCLVAGLGAWAALTLVFAHIDLEWAYRHMRLIPPTTFEQLHFSPTWVAVKLISTMTLVPIIEELVFRGLVLRRLREKYSTLVAIILSALLFALVHFNKSFLGSFLHGIIFAVLAVKYGSLYMPILLHGLYNGAVVILGLTMGFCMSVQKNSLTSVAFWTPELICLLVSLIIVTFYLYCPDRVFPKGASGSRTP
jgi:hypothetical protein